MFQQLLIGGIFERNPISKATCCAVASAEYRAGGIIGESRRCGLRPHPSEMPWHDRNLREWHFRNNESVTIVAPVWRWLPMLSYGPESRTVQQDFKAVGTVRQNQNACSCGIRPLESVRSRSR
jgi:hypothetical protein